MAEKTKDLFLDMLENPNLTLEDLASVGHSAESTRFLDKSAYENSQKVRSKFTDANGNFEQAKFDKWYALAAKNYQELTDADNNLSLLNVAAFNESDITVSPDKRTLNTAPIVSLSPNPDRLSTSIFRIGRTSEREKSQSELAQAEQILLNPVEAAADPSKAKWGDSPNDSWWSNFFDTQVLAQWDEDGEHIDPVTGQKVTHKKGELKLNDNGTYYYEALDGRDIYGRQVLNKMNTITTDGSFWNQYDFFDSDDIKEKSITGSVAKNLALVGSMFIPYVGWGIAAASVATQVVGLTGTLGKMLTGSNSPTFSAMEGWAKSLNRQTAKSEYAQQNMLCWENFIDLIGDTTAQLREQRAIFKFVPALLGKGKYGIDSEALGANAKTFKEMEETALRKSAQSNLNPGKLMKAVGGDDPRAALSRAYQTGENIISNLADKRVADYLKDYNSLGEKIARAYMVGITVGDTYGEAKEAGATDAEATMLTLGYAAAENALLNTELGRWIFPELKAEGAEARQIAHVLTKPLAKVEEKGLSDSLTRSGIKETRSKLIAEALNEAPKDLRAASESLGSMDKSSKLAWMKSFFNKGKEIFDTQKGVMGGTAKAAFAHALAEGTEEVSEELLKDFSTSCFNLVKASQGSDVRMNGFLGTWDWNEALRRYGMSFFGGLLGGAINSASMDYRQFKDIANMNSQQAMEKLVWMDRNGKMDEFWDKASKETLGNKNLSTEQYEDGTYKPGTPQNNQDLEAKRALRAQIDLIHNILSANGATLNDEGLIGQVMHALPGNTEDILGDFRTNALAKSVTAGRFLNEYNKLCSAIILEESYLKNLKKQTIDSVKPTEDQQQAIDKATEALKGLKEAKDNLLQGKRTTEFYKDALFETTYGVSEAFLAPTEVQFMEQATGKSYSLITEDEKKSLKDEYVNWSKTERAEQIHRMSEIFYNQTTQTSKALQDSAAMFQQIKDGQLKALEGATNLSENYLNALLDTVRYGGDTKNDDIQSIISEISRQSNPLGENGSNIFQENVSLNVGEESLVDSKAFYDTLKSFNTDTTLTEGDKAELATSAYITNVSDKLLNIANDITKTGFIHPEVKRVFLPILKNAATFNNDLKLTLEDKADDLEADSRTQEADQYTLASERIEQVYQQLNQKVSEIEQLNYTPISENLRNFAVGLGASKSVLDLLEDSVKKETTYQDAAENIIIDANTSKQFKEAENLLKFYRASIVASRNDNADVDHIFGYNKSLNELLSSTENWVPLAEIDGETADLAIQDINMALKRLHAIKGISDLNQGNKMNVQNYTSANKNFILYNKSKQLITNLLNEDDDDAKAVQATWSGLNDLKNAIKSLKYHETLGGQALSDRTLALSTDQKKEIEKEQHLLSDAIYDFFQKNQDKLQDNPKSTQNLSQFIRAAKLGYLYNNDEILTQDSETIDDNAFTWWLAAQASLKSSDFYKEYRKIITDDIAPIPTQELGVYTAIAAIYNGDVFKAFGKAAKEALYEDWCNLEGSDPNASNATKSKRAEWIREHRIEGITPYNGEENILKGSDYAPNLFNMLFIEGVAGSGKTQSVLKQVVSFLKHTNPTMGTSKLSDRGFAVAHTTKENAEELATNLNFENGTKVNSYSKQDLLSWMSPEYKNREDLSDHIYKYTPEDIVVKDDVYHSKWAVRQLPVAEVPAVIFIDEISQYTQAELDLVNRFASEYGSRVITCGDLDQLSPTAWYLPTGNTSIKDEGSATLTIARNIMPRVPKLGVSMRAGNAQKVNNMYALRNWKNNKTASVQLDYVETDKDIWGDKVFEITDKGEPSDSQITEITKDVDKMIANLQDGEQIGYIWNDSNSKLYKLLSQDKYKGKILFKNEVAAQGAEARYYIVETNRSIRQSEEDAHKSLYTGMTRASQASLMLVNNLGYGSLHVQQTPKRENILIPDNFTKDGIARFSKQRKALLDNLYNQDQGDNLLSIVPMKQESIDISETTPTPLNNTDNTNGEGSSQQTTTQNSKSSQSQSSPSQSISKFPVGMQITDGQISGKITSIEYDAQGNPVYKVDFGRGVVPISETDLLNSGYHEDITIAPSSQQSSESQNFETQNQVTNTPTTETSPTIWEVTEDNLAAVNQAIREVSYWTEQFTEEFKISDLERNLNVNKGDLSSILTELINQGIITAKGNDIYAVNDNTRTPINEPQPKPNLYKAGDQFYLNRNEAPWEITAIEGINDTGEYQYKIKRGDEEKTISESVLFNYEKEGFKLDPNTQIKQDELIPELPSTSQSEEDLMEILEEEAVSQETPVEEASVQQNHDIKVPLLGHTWNTNYVGVNFDEQTGRPIMSQQGEPGFRRIDSANGLIKLNPEKFVDAKTCREAIGAIRKAMQFKDNEGIAKVLKTQIPALANQELHIEWAFISKAAHRNGDGGRFYYDSELRLDNMEDENHAIIPTKTISMLVQDQQGNCVLEMPLFSLGSPFTLLYQIGKSSPNNAVYLAYKEAANSQTPAHIVLDKVINTINTLPTTKDAQGNLLPGYKKLQNLCKLWKFSSDGIRLIRTKQGGAFNPNKFAKTLGPKFTKDRVMEINIESAQAAKFTYQMQWHDLTKEAQRPDVNYSSIMMFNSEYDDDFQRLGAPGHPFVLRSDSDAYKTDDAMMRRWLEQRRDPSLDPIVKLELLTPPQTDIVSYLEGRAQDREYHYGNMFTAYRLLNIIRTQDHEGLWQELTRETREKLVPILDGLTHIEESLRQETGENHQEYLSRIYKEQREYMDKQDAVNACSKALFDLTWGFNNSSQKVFLKDKAIAIKALCDKTNPVTGRPFMTGVLYRITEQQGNPVCGVGYRIKTGTNKYTSEDNKSYRIYSRYDTPIFNLDNLSNLIGVWANDYSVQGNIYRFNRDANGRDEAYQLYNAEGKGIKPIEESPNQRLRKKHARLLAKLGLNDYSGLDNINDELQFLEAVKSKYTETPGNVAVVLNNTVVTSRLDNTNISSSDSFDTSYTTAVQENFITNNDGDNSYTLTLKFADGSRKNVRVEIFPDRSEMIFDLGFPTNTEALSMGANYDSVLSKLNDAIKSANLASNNEAATQYAHYRQIIEEGIAAGLSHEEIIQKLTGGKSMKKAILKRLLGKEFFETSEQEEQKICPIRVHKNI